YARFQHQGYILWGKVHITGEFKKPGSKVNFDPGHLYSYFKLCSACCLPVQALLALHPSTSGRLLLHGRPVQRSSESDGVRRGEGRRNRTEATGVRHPTSASSCCRQKFPDRLP